jgi:hypothetical protein
MEADVTGLGRPVDINGVTMHEQAVIDGVEWSRGDLFYVHDRHGVPRPWTFQYVGPTGIVCYSRQHYKGTAAGFHNRTPTHTAVSMDPLELEFRQLAADLVDIGKDTEAARLLGVLAETGDPDEIDRARRRALTIIDDAADAPL